MSTLETQDAVTINYTDHGTPEGGTDLTPVVLIHGITERAATWDPIVERLTGQRRVITMDLRGHGGSGKADRYDLEAMAGDVGALLHTLDLVGRAHLVGHSLGGAVVSAVGAAVPVASIVDVDQSLQLGAFKAQLAEVESMLRDPAAFPTVIAGIFEQMAGPLLTGEAKDRVDAIRQADQDVVLGVWELLFSMSEAEIDGVVAGALGGYAGGSVPYLALFGIDPGDEYETWLTSFIPGATVELWADHGHYPHLVDPDRFVARLDSFWT